MNPNQLRLVLPGALALALVILVAMAWPNGGARPGTYAAHDSAPAVPGELVVQFRDGTTPGQREALLELTGGTVKREMSLPGYFVVKVPAGQEDDAGRRLAASPAVATVDRNILREPAAAPTDPSYPQQWNMPAIGLEAAREVSDGSGVTVAILDTGVAFENYFNASKNLQFGHAPDLANTNFVDPCDTTSTIPCYCVAESANCQCEAGNAPCANSLRNTHPNDDFGHGTHIAGTIAQDTDNGYGAAGVAPGASIMPIKVCYRISPTSYGCPPADIADGITYAVQQGADVINMSITGEPGDGISQAERDALAAAEAAGVPVIAAAGNYGANLLGYPAAVDSVISVGAVGMALSKAGYSSYGTGEGGTTLDIVAPGGDTSEGPASVIWQQAYNVCTNAANFTTFPEVTSCFGTSMSAGHVSAVVALIMSAYPDVDLDDVREILSCSAQDLGDPGDDLRYGAGLVRADTALEDVDSDNVPDCVDPFIPTPTPTPGPTFPPPTDNCLSPSITPSPSPTPEPEPTPTETPSPTPSETIPPTDTPIPTDSPTPSPTLEPTPTPDPMATASPTPTITPEAPSPPPKVTPTPVPTLFLPGCGDVDCSGFVNAADALGVVAWTANSLPIVQCIGLGYVTCDAILNAADAIAILAYAGGLSNGTSCLPVE